MTRFTNQDIETGEIIQRLARLKNSHAARYPNDADHIQSIANIYELVTTRLHLDDGVMARYKVKSAYQAVEKRMLSREQPIQVPPRDRPEPVLTALPSSPHTSTKKTGLIGKLGWLLAILMIAALCVGVAHKFGKFPRTIRGYDVGTHLDSVLDLLRIEHGNKEGDGEAPATPPTPAPVTAEPTTSKPVPEASAAEPPADETKPAEAPASDPPAPVTTLHRPLVIQPVSLPASTPVSSTAATTSELDLEPLPPLPELPEEAASDTTANDNLIEIVGGSVQAESYPDGRWRIPVLRLRTSPSMADVKRPVTLHCTRRASDQPGIVVNDVSIEKDENGQDQLVIGALILGDADDRKFRIYKIDWVQ